MNTILENKNDGLTRFLIIYRHNNTVEKAHRILGFYYYSSGRYRQAAGHLMFSFLIHNTILIEELIRGQFDFQFTNLDDLIVQARKRLILVNYIQKVEYYKTLYYFAVAMYSNGNTK